jgi:PIN domain nuclease of toxin-antitoxin system
MRLLLDTHPFLWFAWGDPRLGATARVLIEDPDNQKLLSVASIWEIAIKINLGKLALAKPPVPFLVEHVEGNGFEVLAIERRHLAEIATLPLHRRDPFDRMLAAQSLIEPLPLISADAIFDAYGTTRLW